MPKINLIKVTMRNTLWLLFVIIIIYGCNKSEKSIVGKWNLISHLNNNKEILHTYNWDWTFRDSGTLVVKTEYDSKIGSWRIVEDTIYIKTNRLRKELSFIFRVRNSELIFESMPKGSIIKMLFTKQSNIEMASSDSMFLEPNVTLLKIEENKQIYKFFNEVFLMDTVASQLQKIVPTTIPHGEEIGQFIVSLDTILTKDDVLFMKNQIDTLSYTFECNSLINVQCLDMEVIDSLFSSAELDIDMFSVKKTGINGEVRKKNDAWDVFRELYGDGGIHRYSIPIYNKDNTLLIIGHDGQGGWTIGSSGFLIFRKENDHWQYLAQKNFRIS
jgi:hypothetical protein